MVSRVVVALAQAVCLVVMSGFPAGRYGFAQSPASQEPAAMVEGVVVLLGSRQPVAGARVQLERPFRDIQARPNQVLPERADDLIRESTYTAITGPDGRFVFAKVTPGEYRLMAVRSGGYLAAEYGQRSPGGRGTSFQLVAGQKLTSIELVLTPAGVISGRVYDGDEPVGRAQVQALRPLYREGKRSLTIVQSVSNNDRGEYRLFWLPPGQYYVTATRSNEQNSSPLLRIIEPVPSATFEHASGPVVTSRTLPSGEVVEEIQVPVYYPGTTEAERAARIDLHAGATVNGVDIPVTEGPVRTRRIRGIIIDGATGQPVAQASVVTIPRASDPGFVIPNGRSRADGSFDVSGVAPGFYFLFATTRGMTGGFPIQVADTDVENVAIAVTSGFRLSGRFAIDGRARTGSDPSLTNLRVTLRPDPDILGMPNTGPSFSPPPSADGSFLLEGVPPGDFRVSIRALPPDAYVKSMRMGDVDVLDGGLHLWGPPRDPLEIEIGADAGKISGTVVDVKREPLPNVTVAVIPDTNRDRLDLYKSISSDASGRFRIQGLAPGDYEVFAWEDIEEGAWQDPEVIRAYQNRGTPVRVREGSDENVQVTVIPAP